MGAMPELRLLGPFGLFDAAGARVPVTSGKAAGLLALLALSRRGERQRAALQARL